MSEKNSNKIIINNKQIGIYSIKTKDDFAANAILEYENGTLFNTIRIRNLNWYKTEIKFGDLIFLVLGGDRKPWKNGLIAIGKVSNIDFLVEKTKHYEIDVEIQWKLPAELTPNDFYSYPDIKNAPHIGPSLNGTPNQAIGKISKEACLSIFATIENVFDNSKSRIIEIIGEENYRKIFEVPRLNLTSNQDISKNDYFSDIANDLAINSSQNIQEEINNYLPSSIRIDNNQYSVFEIKRKYDKKIIDLASNFQRLDVWNDIKRSELIESVLMGLPIPIFYFNEGQSGELIVVDGKQRLTSFIKFLNNEFSLESLKILSRYNGLRFKDLDPLLQSRIEDYQIQSYVILPPTDETVKFHIFDRVNRPGTQLNKQEIRNALYNGKITELLKEIAESALFREATSNKFVKDNRMSDRYIILRYLAFEYYFEVKNNGFEFIDIDTLLGTAMTFFNRLSDEELKNYHQKVIKGLENAKYYLKELAFINQSNKTNSPINMNIFETQMYYFSRVEKVSEQREFVARIMSDLFNNNDFLDSIGSYRDGKNKIEARFNMMKQLLEENYDQQNRN